MLDSKDEKFIYWFGLTEDGLQTHDYESFEQFLNAKVFLVKIIAGNSSKVSSYRYLKLS